MLYDGDMDSYRFSDFVLNTSLRKLSRRKKPVDIGGRAFDLLALLVQHRDRILSRDEVMTAVWGDTIVGDNNLNVQLGNLRRLLGAGAIITVAGRGLRFGLNVREDTPAAHLPEQPSVAILPFTTMGVDAGLDWLADAFVEDITTELSRFRDLFVLARNSAFAFGAMPRDLRQVSRELGARYLVEGSVRATAHQVRATAQLIDATTGAHIWAENFDADMADLFITQSRIAGAIVTSLAPQIERAEGKRVRVAKPGNLTAYGLAMQGWSVISSGEMAYGRGPRDKASALARQALELDSGSALAWRVLAWAEWWHAYHATTDSLANTLADGIDAATRAIAADPTDHHARRIQGLLHFMKRDATAGLRELRQAHVMNPNCAVTMAWLGLYEGFHGDPARSVPLAQAALNRSPLDPARGSMLAALGFSHFAMRDYGAAAEAAEQALSEAAQSATPLILGAIANVGAGRMQRASDCFARAQEIAPTLVAARLEGRWLTSNPDYLARAHLFFRIAAGEMPIEAAQDSP